MSWTKPLFAVLLVAMAGCGGLPAQAAGVCPAQPGQPLRQVDVFDGPVEDLATLVPDVAKERAGHWQLGYVYAAGRTVNVRCHYADARTVDVELTQKVERCDYRIDARKTLDLRCK
ncbi:STY0301 family protein [Acidovorax sp. SUPP2539]|uniref:STY0301 family protein n=1 Tax=Acidovorax sp. SUPP2539 TaxID=2920878 RepID=UPI0023DE6708|nr:STY0301 family protein [Acidovorax sp. SUPP2539]GKS88491.1 lipoprotein [Acidovorax sp. SUPP2539]